MKKLILSLLLTLYLPFQVSAFNPMVVVSGTSGTSCPPFYADANVIFSVDFNHSSGTNYG